MMCLPLVRRYRGEYSMYGEACLSLLRLEVQFLLEININICSVLNCFLNKKDNVFV